MKKPLFYTGAVALVLNAAAANAMPITGSISFSDGFDTLPAAPTTSIVSGLTAFDVANPIQVSGAVGDFVGTDAATAFDFDITVLPSPFFTTDTGFDFVLGNAVATRTSLVCGDGLCADDIGIVVNGVVTGAGFDPTVFLGRWTANGTCLGEVDDGIAVCESSITASWSVSLTATGEEVPPPGVPEPATLALMGLGLAGIGYRRQRSRKAT